MSVTVIITETPTYVTINETNTEVTLNQSDNPITVTTSTDLIAFGLASDVTYTSHNTLPGGNVQAALEILADQFYRGTDAPTGNNLGEGDLWYDTDDDQLKVYRETSSNIFEFVPLAQATGTMNNLDGGLF